MNTVNLTLKHNLHVLSPRPVSHHLPAAVGYRQGLRLLPDCADSYRHRLGARRHRRAHYPQQE